MTTYRSDIDGLRALAVIAVLLFHAGSKTFGGGFIGVDVFFVISGFLITGLIMSDLDEQRFSVQRFWIRRARRILPALIAVMLVGVLLFTLVYPPILLRNLGQAIAAQSIFVSNILYYLKVGYFDTEAHAKPLLHTWSLSVEEQFYLVIPALLWLLASLRKAVPIVAMAALTCVTLLASVWVTGRYPAAAFFLLPTRAWELGVGAVLALALRRSSGLQANANESKPLENQTLWLPELIAALGLLAIAISIFKFDKNTPFPSYYAVLPVFGTAAIVWANTNYRTLIGKFLSLKPLVAIGLISYSLYLWHWVALSFNRAIQLEEPSSVSIAVALAVSVGAAIFSYKLIEQPIRRGRFLRSERGFVIACSVSTVLLIAVGGVLHITNGLPQRINKSALQIYEAALQKNPRSRECYNLFRRRNQKLVCHSEQGSKSNPTELLIWGDSHADAVYPGLEEAARLSDVPFYFTALGGCPGVWNLYLTNDPTRDMCKNNNDAVIRFIEEKNIKSVILIDRFSVYVDGWSRLEENRKDIIVTSDASLFETTRAKSLIEFKEQFTSMVNYLTARGTKVYVVAQLPSFNVHIPDYFLKAHLLGKKLQYQRPTEDLRQRDSKIDRIFMASKAKIINLRSLFCSRDKCDAFHEGVPLYRDDDHVSLVGARRVARPLAKVFREMSERAVAQ